MTGADECEQRRGGGRPRHRQDAGSDGVVDPGRDLGDVPAHGQSDEQEHRSSSAHELSRLHLGDRPPGTDHHAASKTLCGEMSSTTRSTRHSSVSMWVTTATATFFSRQRWTCSQKSTYVPWSKPW